MPSIKHKIRRRQPKHIRELWWCNRSTWCWTMKWTSIRLAFSHWNMELWKCKKWMIRRLIGKYVILRCIKCIALNIRRRINHVKRFVSQIQHKISVKRCNHQREKIKWHRQVHRIKSPISPFLDCFISNYITGDHSISFT